MLVVRALEERDVAAVVRRIVDRLALDATIQPLVNPVISEELLADSLRGALDQTWVAETDRGIVGHLYGAILDSATYGNGAWVGPDGASFDDVDALSALYAEVARSWIERGALEHYVWTLDEESTTRPWYEMGFARMHRRGVMALNPRPTHDLPNGYVLRRGSIDDLELAVALDDALDDAQSLGPSFSVQTHDDTKREELAETLLDPEVHHYVVEFAGEGVAQCITFPLPPRRGSFESTLHLSAVTVYEDHRGRGVATALVDRAFDNARRAGFDYAETNWRVTNRRAESHWLGYGFSPTYVRPHRTIGSG